MIFNSNHTIADSNSYINVKAFEEHLRQLKSERADGQTQTTNAFQASLEAVMKSHRKKIKVYEKKKSSAINIYRK